ncbi:glycosyltransferase family 39 protein [Leptolyngbya sp. BL0902]|uniref:glycosyltransferase family 39 protein n=1 Tax=Leptolyngbya sp. BL0902 TaxID=1115757 RepID=UPI0018E7AD74|nr:glycosyltransferase family 39 protein [Leptolyngbya sp. BL0902]
MVSLSLLLRFFYLDFRPIWLDESYTALFSLGQGFDAVPRNILLPVSAIHDIFTLRPSSCPEIAHRVATQDIHPPLFFCGLHYWLKGIAQFDVSLAWGLRSFSAILGVVSVIVLYALNRGAFSPMAGLMAAALMAVSPFHVDLSQEARHYTAPMLCVALALLGLVQIINNLGHQRIQLWIWIFWLLVNIIGLYTHYFFLIAVVAQIGTLLLWMLRHRSHLTFRHWTMAGLAIIALLSSYLPWLPIILDHMGRPETNWIALSRTSWVNYIPPIYQKLAGWIIMVVSFPVEQQPAWIAIPMGVLMVVFFGWLMKEAYGGLRQLRHDSRARTSAHILICFIGLVLLQFWVIIYVLGKDLSLAPRYNFVYYPAVCALLGATLVNHRSQEKWSINSSKLSRINIRFKSALPLLAGGISCIFVIFNLALTTPYNPENLADEIVPSSPPQLFLMPYQGDTEIALGLSLMWEISQRSNLQTTPLYWSFLPFSTPDPRPTASLDAVPLVPLPTATSVDLWLLGFRWLPKDFPDQIQGFNADQDTILCQAKPDTWSSATLPHQQYGCEPVS